MKISTLKVYINPKCSKSRKLLETLKNKKISCEEIHYLEVKLTESEILRLAKAANTQVKNLIRKKENVYSDLDINWEDDELAAKAITDNPILLERPIAWLENKAMIVRSDEAINELLNLINSNHHYD